MPDQPQRRIGKGMMAAIVLCGVFFFFVIGLAVSGATPGWLMSGTRQGSR